MRKIALGGAQFGMRYGIANQDGQPSYAAVGAICRQARELGISLVDTAQAYGDSESVLGRAVGSETSIRVVTKARPIRRTTIEPADVETVDASFSLSLRHLRRDGVYGLLIHEPQDFLAGGGHRLWRWLESMRAAGKAEKIGVSVYSPDQLRQILERYPGVQIVQLPFNIYDQRFARSGMLDDLRRRGIEVHARSAFLQGLLLMAADSLPDRFKAIRDHQARLHRHLHEIGLSPLAGALAVCTAQARIDRVVVGCDNPRQLAQIAAAADEPCPDGLGRFAIDDEAIVNPSLWAPAP